MQDRPLTSALVQRLAAFPREYKWRLPHNRNCAWLSTILSGGASKYLDSAQLVEQASPVLDVSRYSI